MPERVPPGDAWTKGVGLIVAGRDHTSLIGMGTGFVAAPHLVLTARHVIDQIFKKFTGAAPAEATGDLDFGVQFALFDRDVRKQTFDVTGYILSPTIDIAALTVFPDERELLEVGEWPVLELDMDYPVVGDPVVGVGLPGTRTRVLEGDEARLVIQPSVMPGKVIDVHYRQREGYMLKFPCFQTDARFPSGASGGPVLDAAGRVRGVVCTSFDDDGDAEAISYASAIWPALALAMDVRIGDERPARRVAPYPLKDEADRGNLHVRNLERVEVAREHGSWNARWRMQSSGAGKK